MTWSTHDIADQTGRRAIITGVTGGLGLHTALGLARKGAALTVTARDSAKADATVKQILQDSPGTQIEVIALDLADLANVKSAAAEVVARHERIDILINNAGIMATPRLQTVDGFELQIGTNHLGHFAWTAALWPLLDASNARIVSVSSLGHRLARGFDLRSLTTTGSPRRYARWKSYGESKLANLVFALELDRRAKAAGSGVISVACHPGYASTNLTRTGPSAGGLNLPGMGMHQITRAIAQSAASGAWSSLRAATDPDLHGGEFIGPAALGGTRGRPQHVGMDRLARDEHLAEEIWTASETATGVDFEI